MDNNSSLSAPWWRNWPLVSKLWCRDLFLRSPPSNRSNSKVGLADSPLDRIRVDMMWDIRKAVGYVKHSECINWEISLYSNTPVQGTCGWCGGEHSDPPAVQPPDPTTPNLALTGLQEWQDATAFWYDIISRSSGFVQSVLGYFRGTLAPALEGCKATLKARIGRVPWTRANLLRLQWSVDSGAADYAGVGSSASQYSMSYLTTYYEMLRPTVEDQRFALLCAGIGCAPTGEDFVGAADDESAGEQSDWDAGTLWGLRESTDLPTGIVADSIAGNGYVRWKKLGTLPPSTGANHCLEDLDIARHHEAWFSSTWKQIHHFTRSSPSNVTGPPGDDLLQQAPYLAIMRFNDLTDFGIDVWNGEYTNTLLAVKVLAPELPPGVFSNMALSALLALQQRNDTAMRDAVQAVVGTAVWHLLHPRYFALRPAVILAREFPEHTQYLPCRTSRWLSRGPYNPLNADFTLRREDLVPEPDRQALVSAFLQLYSLSDELDWHGGRLVLTERRGATANVDLSTALSLGWEIAEAYRVALVEPAPDLDMQELMRLLCGKWLKLRDGATNRSLFTSTLCCTLGVYCLASDVRVFEILEACASAILSTPGGGETASERSPGG